MSLLPGDFTQRTPPFSPFTPVQCFVLKGKDANSHCDWYTSERILQQAGPQPVETACYDMSVFTGS